VKTSRSIACGAVLGIALGTASVTAEAACVADLARQPIHVSVDASGQPTVDKDEVHACIGENLRWVFNGPVAREFSVLFTSVADSPFDWSQQKGATVVGTVKGTAVKDGQSTPYKYAVDVDGKKLDPRIIVDP
jgi:hypothetical protein